jgi:hypothetical protein
MHKGKIKSKMGRLYFSSSLTIKIYKAAWEDLKSSQAVLIY